jgi:hypothetical protein
MNNVKVKGQSMAIKFDKYGLKNYNLFIRSKALPESALEYDRETDIYTITAPARFAPLLGVKTGTREKTRAPLSPHLFDFQQFIVNRAVDARRFACWCDCIAGETIIQSPDGNASIKELAERGKPIRIWALNDDGKPVIAQASAPFKKGTAPLYEFKLASGRSITVTKGHRFLSDYGWMLAGAANVGTRIAVCEPSHLQSIQGHGLSEFLPGAQRWHHILADSRGHYGHAHRPDGQQPQSVGDIAQVLFPLQGDAHEHSQPLFYTDDSGNKSEHNHHHQIAVHLSMLGLIPLGNYTVGDEGYPTLPSCCEWPVLSNVTLLRFYQCASPAQSIRESGLYKGQAWTGGRSESLLSKGGAISGYRIASLPVGCGQPNILTQKLSLGFASPAPSNSLSGRYALQYSLTSPHSHSLYYDTVVSIKRNRKDIYYDMHVPGYENYLANGIWNHNTGLGKSHIFLEWQRQVEHLTGGRVLILSPLQITPQTRHIAGDYFNLDIEQLDTREELAAWCKSPGHGFGICNYEKLIAGVMPELRYLAGLVLDESSILKSGGGVIKWNLIKSARGIEYKLSCTATPAPNEVMEYASQASFLEKLRTEGDILWTYFVRDKRGDWKVKPHAREAFYRFMVSWSVYMRNPVNFGFKDILATLPPPDVREYKIDITPAQREMMHIQQTRNGHGMFNDRVGIKERIKLSQIAKGFIYETTGTQRKVIPIESRKPDFVADLVRHDAADGLQVLVWTVFDAESDILAERLANLNPGVLNGSMGQDERQAVINRFLGGELRVLISKAELLGYGLNFQNCQSMVFSGFDDSFERMYQAIRRAYRFGQTETVRVHIPYIPELEGMIFENVQAKERQFMADVAEQEKYYREALGL